jgi:hypothetical protein
MAWYFSYLWRQLYLCVPCTPFDLLLCFVSPMFGGISSFRPYCVCYIDGTAQVCWCVPVISKYVTLSKNWFTYVLYFTLHFLDALLYNCLTLQKWQQRVHIFWKYYKLWKWHWLRFIDHIQRNSTVCSKLMNYWNVLICCPFQILFSLLWIVCIVDTAWVMWLLFSFNLLYWIHYMQ